MNGTGLCGLSPLAPARLARRPRAPHRASAVMCATTDHQRTVLNAPTTLQL